MAGSLQLVGFGLLALGVAVESQAACPSGTLWEPYSEACADVRDVQAEFLPALQEIDAVHSGAPVPGSMSAGISYGTQQLVSLESGRLHTRMFVYPDGLERDAPLPAWLYTTATARIDDGLEVLAMYAEDQETAHLGLFAWPCLPDFPCPNGSRVPGWQWSRPLPELACNITQIVDQGGHAQKQLYYANHTDRMDEESPPSWRSAVYLWNYCDGAWDLAWEHEYRQDKRDCSATGLVCAWWGPSIETFGDTMYPRMVELGYEDSLLYHDGSWSRLLPPEAEFRDPADPSWGALTPWQLFHLEANRSYGVGNWVNDNDPPVIEGQSILSTGMGEPLVLDTTVLNISDPDIDPAYHVDYQLTAYGGENYTYSSGVLTPAAGFTGTLAVPVSVNDGAAESPTFELTVTVGEASPEIIIKGQAPLETPEEQPLDIRLDDLIVDYSGNDPAALGVVVHAGLYYVSGGTTVTPEEDFSGNLTVPVTVTDGVMESDVFDLTVTVSEVNDPPVISGQRPVVTTERIPVEITLEHLLLSDPDDVASELSVQVLDGVGYERAANIITPLAGIVGELVVEVVASDGELDSAVFDLAVQVTSDIVPPEIELLGLATISVDFGSAYVDAGATATDNVDGDVSDRIVADNPVDTYRAGTYVVTYSVEDLAGNAASAARTVIVDAASPATVESNGGGSGGGGAMWLLTFALAVEAVVLGHRKTQAG
jgi:hypothetical protein